MRPGFLALAIPVLTLFGSCGVSGSLTSNMWYSADDPGEAVLEGVSQPAEDRVEAILAWRGRIRRYVVADLGPPTNEWTLVEGTAEDVDAVELSPSIRPVRPVETPIGIPKDEGRRAEFLRVAAFSDGRVLDILGGGRDVRILVPIPDGWDTGDAWLALVATPVTLAADLVALPFRVIAVYARSL